MGQEARHGGAGRGSFDGRDVGPDKAAQIRSEVATRLDRGAVEPGEDGIFDQLHFGRPTSIKRRRMNAGAFGHSLHRGALETPFDEQLRGGTERSLVKAGVPGPPSGQPGHAGYSTFQDMISYHEAKISQVSEIDDLRSEMKGLTERLRRLEDHLEITQLVAQYGPDVDSGSADETAALWTENGTFDAVGAMEMSGREQIADMVRSDGHQQLIAQGCGHILTVPHVVVQGDEATGRSYALNIRWDADAGRFWVARVSANTWKWERTPEGWRISARVNANLDGTAEHRRMLSPVDRADD